MIYWRSVLIRLDRLRRRPAAGDNVFKGLSLEHQHASDAQG